MRIVVGISGATGAILGVRTLEVLRALGVETHLVISKWGARTIEHETEYSLKQVQGLASSSYSSSDQSAPISSGSFKVHGMVIAPTSMKTLGAIANGIGGDLLTRAADVTLKEQRKLVLVARETPLNVIHLENMSRIVQAGGVVFPPVPAFYNHPQSVDDVVHHLVVRLLDCFDIDAPGAKRWEGGLRTGRRRSAAIEPPGRSRPLPENLEERD